MGVTIAAAEELVLSVIVPVYNGEAFIADTVPALVTYLAAWPHGAELIFVDDGSTDQTPMLLQRAAAGVPIPIRILRTEINAGKGAAIARGMRVARGAHRVFLDADLAYPPGEIAPICTALAGGADVAIASRGHRLSRLLIRPVFLRYFVIRHLVGRLFNWLVRLLLLPRIVDSQAGLKGFTAAAADRLFGGWLPRGFSFDVALLLRARRLGLEIAQVPVLYRYENEPTTVRLVRDTTRALRDLVRIRVRMVSDRLEQWSAVLERWRENANERVGKALQSIAARTVLATTFGLCVITLFTARLALSDGRVAVLGWLGALCVLLLLAWRADFHHVRPGGRLLHGRTEAVLFLAILAVCAALRLVWLQDEPPMLHGDSAECGFLGLALLHHKVPDIFDFSPWYDTPYISFVPYAASFALSGLSIFGLRLPSALMGVAVIVPLYLLVRVWFGARAALLAAALFAVSHSAIHFSRIGLWNIQVLFYEVTAFALLVVGLRRGSAVWTALAGVISGLALYSYTAGRLIPVIAVAFLVAQLTRRQRRRAVRALAYYAAGLLVAATPLLINYVKDPTVLRSDRTASVWVLAQSNRAHVEDTLGTAAPLAVLWEQTKRTLAGFATRGDASTQYGTEQPLLSPLTALLCVFGLAIALWRWREPRHLFLIIWLVLGLLLGSVLVIDPPSYTRLVVLFPVPYILVAITLEAVFRTIARRTSFRRAEVVALCVLVLAQAAAFNLIGYYKFTRRMSLMPREWDVLKVVERLGARYDYYLYTGPFLLADSPVFRLFSTGTRAECGFTAADLPDRLARDAAFVLTPEFRDIGMAISERFPGAERDVIDQDGVRQLLVYRCTAENGCRRSRS